MTDAGRIAPKIEPQAGPNAVTVHATAVALKDYGLLITGDPGAGKTTLALELMTLGAGLVADDWVVIERGRAGGLVMSPPHPIAGLIEIAGIGMVRLPYTDQAPMMGIVDLNREPYGRMPTQGTRTVLGTPFVVVQADPAAGAGGSGPRRWGQR